MSGTTAYANPLVNAGKLNSFNPKVSNNEILLALCPADENLPPT